VLEWKLIGRTGHVMPVLVPFRDVGMAGKLIVNVKEAKGLHIKKGREASVEICLGEHRSNKLKRITQRCKPCRLVSHTIKWETELVIPIAHLDRVLRLKLYTHNSKNVIKNRNEVGKLKIPISPLLLLLHPKIEDAKENILPPRSPQSHATFSDLRRRSTQIAAKQCQYWFDLHSSKDQVVGQIHLGFRLHPEPGAKIKAYHTPFIEEVEKRRNMPSSSKQQHVDESMGHFGVELENVMEQSRYQYPEVCFHVVEYLRETGGVKEPGIFRKEGRESTIRELAKSFDQAKPVTSFSSPHDAAGLLKLFFRSLPESIIPPLHLGPFIEANQSDNLKVKIDKFKVILAALPESNRKLLRFLMGFLNEVHCHAKENKMEAKNLATCWTPSLVYLTENDKDDKLPLDIAALKAIASPDARSCIELLITHQRDIFYTGSDSNKSLQGPS